MKEKKNWKIKYENNGYIDNVFSTEGFKEIEEHHKNTLNDKRLLTTVEFAIDGII